MQRAIYLDSNATHPPLLSVRQGLAKALLEQDDCLGNPSSIHRKGQSAKKLVADLRAVLCQYFGRPDGEEFVFLSGATEAINLAVRGFAADRKLIGRKPFFISTNVEHAAVKDTIVDTGEGFAFLAVDSQGQLNVDETLARLNEALDKDFDVMFAIQVANNETGVCFNLDALLPLLVKQAASRAKSQRLWILLDAAQAVGKLEESHIRRAMHFADYMAISAHKIGGAAGMGALWLRPGSPSKAQMTGGVQERRRRAGTVNTLGILGLHLAFSDWLIKGSEYRAQMKAQREFLIEELSKIEGLEFHGEVRGSQVFLPNTLNFHVEGCRDESLLVCLDLEGFYLSSGSACNSGSLKPSPVLLAMGYSQEVAASSIRVSLGVESTHQEIESFAQALSVRVAHIRASRLKSTALFGDISPVVLGEF